MVLSFDFQAIRLVFPRQINDPAIRYPDPNASVSTGERLQLRRSVGLIPGGTRNSILVHRLMALVFAVGERVL